MPTSQSGAYAEQIMAELRRLGAGQDRIREIMAEVHALVGNTVDQDLPAVFGSAKQFAGDVLADRWPLRADYLRRLRAEMLARGVADARISEVLTAVSTSREFPMSAFGPPGEYAASVAAEAGMPHPQVSAASRIFTGALSTAATLLAVEGVVGLVRHQGTGGRSPREQRPAASSWRAHSRDDTAARDVSAAARQVIARHQGNF